MIKIKKYLLLATKAWLVELSAKVLKKNGYKKLLNIESSKLNLTNFSEVADYLNLQKPEVVVIAAAKVGGISANSKYPVEFLLNNLRIQNNLIELSFKAGVKRLLFLGVVVFIQNMQNNLLKKKN